MLRPDSLASVEAARALSSASTPIGPSPDRQHVGEVAPKRARGGRGRDGKPEEEDLRVAGADTEDRLEPPRELAQPGGHACRKLAAVAALEPGHEVGQARHRLKSQALFGRGEPEARK